MAFALNPLGLEGCFEILPKVISDHRGLFVKTFHQQAFEDLGIPFDFAEEYFSISQKNVLRGMHFQLPPHAYIKLVYCIEGAVLDVLLDLRKQSKTYGQTISLELSSTKRNLIYMPVGIAHGFYTQSEQATLIYKTSVGYHPESDTGILWSSFNFDWPSTTPILSARDKAHPTFAGFKNPF